MLADTVGTRVAQHALQRSLMSTPTEAVAMGLVDELCGADALTQLAYDRLATFTRIPPLARAETKLQQRAHIAEMTGPQSVADMSRVVLVRSPIRPLSPSPSPRYPFPVPLPPGRMVLFCCCCFWWWRGSRQHSRIRFLTCGLG